MRYSLVHCKRNVASLYAPFTIHRRLLDIINHQSRTVHLTSVVLNLGHSIALLDGQRVHYRIQILQLEGDTCSLIKRIEVKNGT